MLQMIK